MGRAGRPPSTCAPHVFTCIETPQDVLHITEVAVETTVQNRSGITKAGHPHRKTRQVPPSSPPPPMVLPAASRAGLMVVFYIIYLTYKNYEIKMV